MSDTKKPASPLIPVGHEPFYQENPMFSKIKARAFLNPQELATVLAALRVFQNARRVGSRYHGPGKRIDQMERFADVQPLTDGQIDSLCERLNAEGLNG